MSEHAVNEQIITISHKEKAAKKNITIGALIQGIYTLISRLAGMVRDVIMFHIFGVGALTDAFNVAFTIPNVLRRFFAEGAFAVAFVPVYMTSKERDGEEKARLFFKDSFGLLMIALTIVTCLGVIFSETLVRMFAFGFTQNAEQFALTNLMTKWLFPYVFMVSIVALFGAYLQCHNRFSAMSASPIYLNIAMIITMYAGVQWFDPPVMVLAAGVVIGGCLQVVMMIVALKRAGLWAWPTMHISTDAMRHLLRLLGPALFGVFVYQLNIMVLRQLASFLGPGQISYYYNADRLTQVATGVFGVSIATAALPELSKGAAKTISDSFHATLRFTLVLTSFVITPSAVGLMMFAYPIVAVLFVHGAFTIEDAAQTARTLVGFSPSLIAFSLSRPIIQAFYAQSDTRTPVLVGIVTVILNLTFGIVLLRYEVVGLAATLSISSFIQYIILQWLFKKKCGHGFMSGLLKPIFQHAMIAVVACLLGSIPAYFGDWDTGLTFSNVIVLSLVCGVSGLSYLMGAYLLKLEEAVKFIQSLRAKF